MPRGRPRKAGDAESMLRQMLAEREQETRAEIANLIRTRPISEVLLLLEGSTGQKRRGRPPKGRPPKAAKKTAGRKRAKRRTKAQMAKAQADKEARIKVKKRMKLPSRGRVPADKQKQFAAALKAELAKG